MRYNTYLVLVVCELFASGVGAQQTPPPYDAGALMRQTEQMMRQKEIQRSPQQRTSLPPAAVFNESTAVQVDSFKFNGNRLLSNEQLQVVAAPFANRVLNEHDLRHLTDALSEAYRQIGWFVQAYIPRQDLGGHELTVQLIESIPPNKPIR